MNFMQIIPIIIIVLAILLVVRNVVIVPQAMMVVTEVLGQYKSTWKSGLHIKIPLIERVVKRVSTKEKVRDFPPQPVITKDNVTVEIDSVVFFEVFDAYKYTYGTEDPELALQNISATTLRNIIGEMLLDETLTSRDVINGKLTVVLDDATDKWGIRVNRVEVKNIDTPDSIQDAMEKQMKAERDKREALLRAEAHRDAVVMESEGKKRAKILAAEAERDSKLAIAEAEAKAIEMKYRAEANGLKLLSEATITEGMIKIRSIEAMKDIADGNSTKVFIPSDMASVLSLAGSVGEMLKPVQSQKKVDDPSTNWDSNLGIGDEDIFSNDGSIDEGVHDAETQIEEELDIE